MSDQDRFLRRLLSVPEAAMRAALWREAFDTRTPEAVLSIVDALLVHLEHRDDAHRPVYLSLIDFLSSHRAQPYEPRRALYEAARLSENERVCRLLLSAPPAKDADQAQLKLRSLADDREPSLGERRSWARTPNRARLLRLLADPDPVVIAHVLQNPRLTESDVLRIASRRPTAAAALEAVFHHPRWGSRAEIQRALVYNPYTPAEIAIGLVELLDRAELFIVSRDPGVSAGIRQRAVATLQARHAARTPTETT